jgi:hypothetical protein
MIFSKFGVLTRIVGYLFCSARNACACVLNARVYVHSLIFERILFKFGGNILRLTISVKDYVLFMFMHWAHACERACAWACVIKHSRIYGPILFKFAVNILQLTMSSFSCSLTSRTRASERVVKTYTYLLTDSLQICWAHTTNNHKLHGLHTYHVHAPRARGQAHAINCSLIYGWFLFKFQLTTSRKGYVLFMFTHHARVRVCVCERECASAWLSVRSS